VRKATISQGALDGFCGVYALAHIVAVRTPKKYKSIFERLFFELLKALEKSNLLTAKRISSVKSKEKGFEVKFLVEAFNAVPSKHRGNLLAVDFSSPEFGRSEFYKRADVAFEHQCAFVAAVNARSHWVATSGRDSDRNYACYDPSPDEKRTSFGRIHWDEGLMVGPSKLVTAL
jgi:hypothetical protein